MGNAGGHGINVTKFKGNVSCPAKGGSGNQLQCL
ncbi:hypothetical protein R5R35_013255 [Gryllus longicercus]|uniref:Uncharacterized protein n=1 Tax=Gryllus longicercus TaxID=2509291 RepID=A0AAN9WTK7_9ORTH